MSLSRWLDPPAVRERKRWLRAQPRARGEQDLEIGCLVPIGVMLVTVLVTAIAVGVVAGLNVRTSVQTPAPREAVVRVIDDSAKPGPKVIGTAIVRLP